MATGKGEAAKEEAGGTQTGRTDPAGDDSPPQRDGGEEECGAACTKHVRQPQEYLCTLATIKNV